MLTELFWRKVGLEFARTFLTVFVLGVIPVASNLADTKDWDTARAALLALVAAAITAALRAAQALFTQLETPPELKRADDGGDG